MRIRLKKLDALIIKSFLGPFVVTFFLVLFTFTMQFYWLYMDELIGKGFGVTLMLQLLLYMSATLVPVALPLGILLAAIMTFGSLGENLELVAIKSSGISLFRFMRSLAIFVLLISIGAFFFSNNVIPVANLKSYSLLYDMRNQRPALNITPGIFNRDMDGFAIRIGEKEKDGQGISDIIIYDHTAKRGNLNVIIAEKGKMYPADGGQSLVFELENGWRYEEDNSKNTNNQIRMQFGKWYKIFDMTKFSFSRTNEELFKSNHEMMNVWQLTDQIDSARKKINHYSDINKRYIHHSLALFNNKKEDSLVVESMNSYIYNERGKYDSSFLERITDSLKLKVAQQAVSSVSNIERSIKMSIGDVSLESTKINKFLIEWHKKFTLSVACFLLFLIGAPLGSIIRKGGLGMPVIVAMCFFVVYFFTSSTGEKLAKQEAFTAAQGMWLSTLVLLPIALFILWQAKDDSPIFNKEAYRRVWNKIVAIFRNNKPSV